MFLPRDQIARRERVHERLLIIGRRIRRKDPVPPIEHMRFGVGIPPREDRIPRASHLRAHRARAGERKRGGDDKPSEPAIRYCWQRANGLSAFVLSTTTR